MHKCSDAFTVSMYIHYKSRYKTYSSGLQRQTTVTMLTVKGREKFFTQIFFLKCLAECVGSYCRYSSSVCYLDLTDNRVSNLNSKNAVCRFSTLL